MRGLAILALVLTLGWCGYWFVGARALDRGIGSALTRVSQVSAASHRILGFPNRFDVTFDAPRVVADGVDWSAPFVQIFALSYRLNHVIAVFANDQALRIRGQDFTLHSADLRASVVMEAGLDLPLDRVSLVGEALELSTDGQTHRAGALRAASRRIAPQDHELAIEVEALFPDAALLRRLDPQELWPRRFDRLRLSAVARTDRPLDRHLVDGAPPRLQTLTLTGARVAWEGIDITATGALEPGPRGLLSGEVSVVITGWQALLAQARAAGALTGTEDPMTALVLNSLATPGNPDRVEAAFALVDGEIWLGPLSLGRVPALW